MVLPGLGSSTAVSISSDSSSTPEMSDLATRKVKSSLRKRMAFSLFRNEKDAAMNGRIEAESREHSSSSTNSDEALISSLKQTTIIATMEVTAKNNIADSGNVEDATFSTEPYGPFCASAYLERMCGVDTRLIREEDHVKRLNKLPDDPSVQESIECVFAAQKDLLLQAEEEEDTTFANLQTPSSLQQCLLKNRSIFHLSPKFQRETRVRSPRKALEAQQIAPPTSSPIAEVEPNARAISAQSDARVCACRSQKRPILEPDKWPQRPLLLRPTPHGGTVVTGIRFAGSKEYLWKAQQSSLTWPEALHHHWKKVSFAPSSTHEHDMMCPHCMILPINNGKELLGESLLSDFESDSFSGSILVRLKDCTGTTCVPGHELTKGYFDGVHRRYQVVVRGQFKQSIPWIECFAGFQ